MDERRTELLHLGPEAHLQGGGTALAFVPRDSPLFTVVRDTQGSTRVECLGCAAKHKDEAPFCSAQNIDGACKVVVRLERVRLAGARAADS